MNCIAAATAARQSVQGIFGLHQPIAIGVIAPGCAQVISRGGQGVTDIGIGCFRHRAPDQRCHCRNMRGSHRSAVPGLVTAGRNRQRAVRRGGLPQAVGHQILAVFLAQADADDIR